MDGLKMYFSLAQPRLCSIVLQWRGKSARYEREWSGKIPSSIKKSPTVFHMDPPKNVYDHAVLKNSEHTIHGLWQNRKTRKQCYNDGNEKTTNVKIVVYVHVKLNAIVIK